MCQSQNEKRSYFDFGLHIRACTSFEEIQIRFSVNVAGANGNQPATL